jgi:hypothetical protein
VGSEEGVAADDGLRNPAGLTTDGVNVYFVERGIRW